MTNLFDVLVVGGGPAGCSAAQSTAKNGLRTLLVEKKSEIGTPIVCGELVPSSAEMGKLLPHADNLHTHYGSLLSDATSNKINSIRVHGPSIGCLEFDFDGVVLDRRILERNLAISSKENGADVVTSCTLNGIVDRGEVKKVELISQGQSTYAESKLIIGADGFPSSVARWLGLKDGYGQNDAVICLHFLMNAKTLEDHTVEMFFDAEYAPGAFGWVIPKGNGKANVGVGIRLSRAKHVSVREIGHRFIRQHPIVSRSLRDAEIIFSSAKLVPVGGITQDVSGNGVLLAGDAAGLPIATNGSGIPSAIASGSLAGQISSRWILGETDLKRYDEELRNQIGEEIKTGLSYRRAGDLFMRSNLLFGLALQLVGMKLLKKIIKCEPSALGSFLRLLL